MASRESSQATASAPGKGNGSVGRRACSASRFEIPARPTSVEALRESAGTEGACEPTRNRARSVCQRLAKLPNPGCTDDAGVSGPGCVVALDLELVFQLFSNRR